LRKKSCQKDWPTFPEAYKGLQVNCCKFTRCENFGISPEDALQGTQRVPFSENSTLKNTERQVSKHHPLYGTSGNGKYEAALVCKTCKNKKADGEIIQSSYMLKSNKAVVEEFERLSRYLATDQPACPNQNCPTYTVEFIEPSFKKRGLTTAGSQRYECKHCKKSFVVGEQTRKQRRPEINIRLFDLLIMHVPLRKIIKHLHISPKTLYDKIDFIHKQCLKFVAEREQQLIDGKLKEKSLYLATDRQVQITNWTKREDKRNTELYGIGTACLTSGYVFAFNFNFDERLSQNDVELVASEYGDNEKPKHHREMARVWLDDEFADATAHKKKLPDKPPYTLQEEVAQKIEDELSAIDMTSSEDFDGTTKLPAKGVLVHNEYTMMGHFLLLKKLTQRIEKTRFYLDQDTGMKTAYLSIFRDEIQTGKSDGFLIRAVKNLSVDEKRNALADTNKMILELTGKPRRSLTGKEFRDLVNDLIIQKLDKLEVIKHSTERWLAYPIATMPESEKLVAAVTNISRYDDKHQANLYRKASLHAIDRFFMSSRRGVNLLERPFTSATNKARTWNGYSAYNPAMLTKMADIYRVCYNYVNKNDDGETPAMRLGLAKGPVAAEKIIYFGKYD